MMVGHMGNLHFFHVLSFLNYLDLKRQPNICVNKFISPIELLAKLP